MRSRPVLASALLTYLLASAATVQAQQLKPYFLVVVDTSTSMSFATDPVTTNSCGYTPEDKMSAAKCVLRRIVDTTGDADFGLMQFSQTTCGTQGGTCNQNPASAWLRVPIQTNSASSIAALVDNVGTDPADELCAGGYTPLGGTLAAAKQYFSGTYKEGSTTFAAPTVGDTKLACRPLAVILLTDGAECCASCMQAWNGCPKAEAAYSSVDCLASGTACTAAAQTDTCPTNGHFETAPERAFELDRESSVPCACLPGDDECAAECVSGKSNKEIKTYAIGFGFGAGASGDPAMERIAIAGNTDAPGTNRAFYSQNETQLAAAFAQIIADSQPPVEECNNKDDDCDGKIDEGIPKFCDKPNGVDDKTLCDEPDETLCDGEDDDCDGLIDEGVLNVCGQCGKVPDEICDGDDNDCDGSVDEGTDGGKCGMNVGVCTEGTLRCIGGEEECTGGVGPGDEICNCKDDDCDGTVDEDIDSGNPLCDNGRCVGCECLDFCSPGEEFMPQCPGKLTPDIQPNGECLCIVDNCDSKECRAMTIEHDDKVACAPDDDDVATCSCKAGTCVALCDGVSCGDDDKQICDPRNGRCVENNCRGLGCDSGKLCDPLEAECVTDACANASCSDTEVCRGGDCEPTCAGVKCKTGERCSKGACVENKCAGAKCALGEACDPQTGECKDNPCAGKSCTRGQVCSLSSGDCERDPCWDVHCPGTDRCSAGECVARNPDPGGNGGKGGSGGSDGDGSASELDPNQRVLATGGGGCACRVADGGSGDSRGVGLGAALLVLGMAGLRMRRRRTAAVRGTAWRTLPWWVLLALVIGGCDVKPYCLDCVTGGGGSNAGTGGGNHTGSGGQNAVDDAMVPLEDAMVDDSGGLIIPDAGVDGSVTPLCKDKQRETCNGKDDDCDFKVDEDTEAEVNDCNQNGVCAGTKPSCVNGDFICPDPPEREDEETLCDGKDSDCDGRVDETFKDLGKDCQVGIGACLVIGKNICNDGGNGLACKVDHEIDPVDEICDGIDNDCDGLIDEPASAPGDAPSFVHDDVVQVQSGKWIYRYEAARADATETKQGVIGNRACARAGVLPWTSLTFAEAKAACAAADMELCAAADWVSACQGGNNCSWSWKGDACPTNDSGYPLSSNPTDKQACNGHDLSAAPGAPDNDKLSPTGAYALCFSEVQGAEKVFDLSGNAKEWVRGDSDADDDQPVRGGSYNNLPGGLLCDSTFGAAPKEVRLPNLGFRCCSDNDPSQP